MYRSAAAVAAAAADRSRCSHWIDGFAWVLRVQFQKTTGGLEERRTRISSFVRPAARVLRRRRTGTIYSPARSEVTNVRMRPPHKALHTPPFFVNF